MEEEQLYWKLAQGRTPELQKKLLRAKVAVAGLGGLGSNIAVMLARSGVGRLLLIDFDRVDYSNLNRQHYFLKHVGQEKTEALAGQIREINPYIQIKTVTARITDGNVSELLEGYPVVCEAFDNPQSKAVLVNGVLEHLPGTVVVAASGMAGTESLNRMRTERRFARLYVCGDMESDMAEACMYAPRVSACAAHQANMVLRLILGEAEA